MNSNQLLEQWHGLSSLGKIAVSCGAVGGLVLIMMFSQNISLSSQLNRSQAQVKTLEEKMIALSTTVDQIKEDGKSATVTQELRQLRDEVIRYRAEQSARDQVLGLTSFSSVTHDAFASIENSLDPLEEAAQSSGSSTLANSSPTPAPSVAPDGTMQGTVRVVENQNWSSVDVFEQALSSSKIIGQMVTKVSYPFFAIQNNWYQVQLSSGKKGWIHKQYIQEE